MLDSSGNLFGATAYGGTGSCSGLVDTGCGLVYELSPVSGGGWREKVIKGFSGIGTSIMNPNPVVLDASGNVYGTSLFGGLEACNGRLGDLRNYL